MSLYYQVYTPVTDSNGIFFYVHARIYSHSMPDTSQEETNHLMKKGKRGLSRLLTLGFIAMVVAGMTFAGTAGAQTAEDYLEPNDERSSATDVGSGNSYDDLSIDDSTDVDYYAVDVEAGEEIAANIEHSHSEGDLDLEIQDTDGSYEAGSYSVSDDESASHVADTSGTYYVQVYGYSGATANYDVSITTEEEENVSEDRLEPNDERSSATDLGTAGASDDLTIHSSGDEDFFQVEADAGDTISAQIAFADDNGDIDLELQDSSGNYLDGSYSVSDDESVEYTVDEGGTYYLRVYPWSGAPNGYDINVSTEGSVVDDGGDYLEPNDERSGATYLGTGGSYDGLSVHDNSDEDFFQVEADAGDTITAGIEFSDDNGDIDMELQDSDGYSLTNSISVSDDETIEYTVEEGGTYYVQVYPWSGAPNDYDIDVSTDGSSSDDDDQIEDGADLRSVSFGESAAGTIDTSDPTLEGYYHEPVTFYGDEGEAVNIDMTSDTGDSYLVLQGPDDEYLTFNDDGGDGLDSSIQDYVLPQSGEYTIVATSYSGDETFNYTLSFEEGEAPEDDDLEPNDDIDSATSLGTGGSYDDLTVSETYGEADYFAVYAQEGQTISAEIQFSHDNGDIDMELQDSSGNYLEGAYSVSDDESVEYTAEESGTYYIEVYAFSGAPNDYSIDVSTSGSADSGGDTNEDLSLSANSTATASGAMEVQFDMENTGDSTQAVILQAGDGVDQLGDGYSISDHEDDGGNWRSAEGSWLFESLEGGDSVNPSVTIDVPEDADGSVLMPVTAESDSGNVTTVVELDLESIGIAQAADTNDNGELEDAEILAAIEAWQDDTTIEGTDTFVSDDRIIDLISTWRSEGS